MITRRSLAPVRSGASERDQSFLPRHELENKSPDPIGIHRRAGDIDRNPVQVSTTC